MTLRTYKVEFMDTDVREYIAEYDNIRDGVILLFTTKDKITAYGIAVAGDKPDNVATLPLVNIKQITSKEIQDGKESINTQSTETANTTSTG